MHSSLLHTAGLAALPIVMIVAHEATHLAVGTYYGSCSIELQSILPVLRFKLSYTTRPPRYGLRLVAVAPCLVGCLVAASVVTTGLWSWLHARLPYYGGELLMLNWLVYSHLSPSDLRTIVRPYREPSDS